MGDAVLSFHVQGAHHNGSPADIDAHGKRISQQLADAGITVKHATMTTSDRHHSVHHDEAHASHHHDANPHYHGKTE